MIKRICDPVEGAVLSVNCIGEGMDPVIASLFAIIEKEGCVIHDLTLLTGGKWVAAQHCAGAEVTNQTRNKGGKREKSYYHKMIPLHKDAMQVETQSIASFSNTGAVPA